MIIKKIKGLSIEEKIWSCKNSKYFLLVKLLFEVRHQNSNSSDPTRLLLFQPFSKSIFLNYFELKSTLAIWLISFSIDHSLNFYSNS